MNPVRNHFKYGQRIDQKQNSMPKGLFNGVNINDVVIIGAGPAGIATAIQLKRCNIEPVLLEKEEIGGLLRNANLVENYPGFPKGISGLKLVDLFKEQLRKIGVKPNFEKVLELDYKYKVFLTKTNRRVITSNFAVIASGTKPKKIPGLHISDRIKERIFYEIYPIRKTKNKRIVIIGAGDAAFDYALNLSKKNEVIILNRSEQAKCIPLLMERCKKSKSISYMNNVSVKEIKNNGKNLMLYCIHLDSKEEEHIYTDYVVIVIGREPNLDFLGKSVKNNFNNLMKNNRLYLVGDVKNEIYRQTAICVGDGVKAAMKIYQTIKKGKNEGNRKSRH